MEEYIDKIKYLKEEVKISLKDVNEKNETPLDNRKKIMCEIKTLEKLSKENKNEFELKFIFQFYSSQLLLLKYEDLDRILKIASKIIIADDCLLYDTFKKIIDKGE